MLPLDLARRISDGQGPVVFLTGAGISAESGIPTFRGEEGYWRVGSRNYQPSEMATGEAFTQMPDELWRWYLYRRGVCRAAQPNEAHGALVALERRLGDRFLLVTQNVDGVHLRAGNSLARTYQIHGNIDYCRCTNGCEPPLRLLPERFGEGWEKDRPLIEAERAALHCTCGAWLRPHVLWFDEFYDEPLFRYHSSVYAAETAAALVVVGTSGATALPSRMCETAVMRKVPLIVVDPQPTPFGALATNSGCGISLQGTACELVPMLADELGSLSLRRA
jgi:NAD-dependent deacetylase